MTDETDTLSVREVAERTGFKPDAIRRAIKRGELDAVKLCGRVRIRVEEYERWLRAAEPVVPPKTTPRPARGGGASAPGAGGSFRARVRGAT